MPRNRVLATTRLLQEEADSQSLYVPQFKGRKRSSWLKYGSSKQFPAEGDQKLNHHCWTLQENILYKQFLIENLPLFEMSLRDKKKIRINVLVSQFVQTRDASQCRSHHQKMLQYHGNIPNIITHIEKLERALQFSAETIKNLTVIQAEHPQTPTSELREIEFPREGSSSLWQSLLYTSPDFEL